MMMYQETNTDSCVIAAKNSRYYQQRRSFEESCTLISLQMFAKHQYHQGHGFDSHAGKLSTGKMYTLIAIQVPSVHYKYIIYKLLQPCI